MTYPCPARTRVIRTLTLTRSLSAAAFTTVLIALAGVALAGQTMDTTFGERPVAGSALASTSLLSATPVISGPLAFLPQEIFSQGSTSDDAPFSATLGDVNGDGKPDLLVVYHSTIVMVLLGNGDGSFQAPQNHDTGLTSAGGLTIADLNGDGKADLLVTGCGASCSPGSVAVLLGNGDGSFKPAVLYSTGGWVSGSPAVGVADVNLDGKLDLEVVNLCTNTQCSGYGSVGVMLGKGDGTFGPVVTYSSGGYRSFNLAVADVNGDGNPDFLVGNGCNQNGCTIYDQSHAVGVLLGRGDGTFGSVMGYASGGTGARLVAAIDLNGDGKLDIVVDSGCPAANCTSSPDAAMSVLLGNGDGSFQGPTLYDTGVWASGGVGGATVADVNGDGKPDVIMTGFCNENSAGCGSALANLFALLGNGNGTFQPGKILSILGTYGGPETLLLGDLNDDNKPDIVLIHGCNLNCALNDLEVGVMLNNSGAPATTIALTSSKNPVPLYASVTYTAKVAGGSGGTIGGTVTFADGDVPVATVSLSANQATYSTNPRTAGIHLITATYSGVFHTDRGSRSVALAENVVHSTKTVLATSGSPTFVGQPVTFTATVSSSYGAIPNGELVKFYDGSTLLASAALSGGKASYTTSALKAKSHSLKAIYVGDSTFATSTGYVNQVVQVYATTTTLTCKPNPSTFGQTVAIMATVKSAGPFTPTGKVVFTDGTTWIGAGTLSGGVVTIPVSNLAMGTHSIKATYNGDGNSATSSSAVVSQVVQ